MLVVNVGFGARRCDSEMRRRSSRSWARSDGASSGRGADDFLDVSGAAAAVVSAPVGSGGRED
jgi:hypothetical protein